MDNKISKSRDELKEDYKCLTLGSDMDKEIFSTNCLRLLEENGVSYCFKLLPLNDVKNSFLKKALKKAELGEKRKTEGEIKHLVKIFQIFEKYAANILAKPWCKELHKIKLYTGFFKYNFEQWLSSKVVSSIFKFIGYEKTSNGTLKFQTTTNDDRVLVMGFELYMAHTQLHTFERNQHLTSEYSLEDIMEGWLNTTGKVLNIREWLRKNNFAADSRQFVASPNTDMPEERRADSITIGHRSSYDKNGYRIKAADKYPTSSHLGERNFDLPPSNMHLANRSCENKQQELESGLSSLPAADISDCKLYGEDNHATSEDTGKTMSESYSCETGENDYEQMENKYLGNVQQGYNAASHQYPHVVARGGGVDFHQKERFDEIMERRKNHSSFSRQTASSIIQGGIIIKKPTQEPMIADTTSNATVRFGSTCAICAIEPPAYHCSKCGSEVCNWCLNMLPDLACVGSKHVLTNISWV